MDKETIVHNVESLCKSKNVYPTIACRESGAGHSFLSDIKRDRIPAIGKFQLLAQYLGVTTSELLGEQPPNEKKEPTLAKEGEFSDPLDARIMELVARLPVSQKKSLIEKMEFLISMQ